MIRRLTTLLLLFLLCGACWGALPSTVVFEVENGGNDLNGMGFSSALSGTDRSLSTTPFVNINNAAVTATVNASTITFTGGTYTATSADNGNLVHIISSTGGTPPTFGWYHIASQTATTWVLDRTTGAVTATITSALMGGCGATPGAAAPLANVTGHIIWVKYNVTDYTITTATPGAAGPVSFVTAVSVAMRGYDVTRGDNTGNRPTLNWGAVAAPGSLTYLFANVSALSTLIINMRANGNNVNNVGGFSGNLSGNRVVNCYAINCAGTAGIGFLSAAGTLISNCFATVCITGFQGGDVFDSVAAVCATGFLAGSNGILINCLSFLNTVSGFNMATSGNAAINCTASGNTGDGFNFGGARAHCVNCVTTFNGGYGYNTSAANTTLLQNCADYSNTSSRLNLAPILDSNPITLTVDPWINKAGFDFRPNSLAGGGLLLTHAGVGVYGSVVNNQDVGALNSMPSSGSRARRGIQ